MKYICPFCETRLKMRANISKLVARINRILKLNKLVHVLFTMGL